MSRNEIVAHSWLSGREIRFYMFHVAQVRSTFFSSVFSTVLSHDVVPITLNGTYYSQLSFSSTKSGYCVLNFKLKFRSNVRLQDEIYFIHAASVSIKVETLSEPFGLSVKRILSAI